MDGNNNMTQWKVVVIDDEEFVLSLIETMLEDEGFVVFTARDGATGWEKIQSVAPDLVVTDVRMPGMNGMEICKACEGIRSLRDFPIFVLTGETDQASKDWFRQLRNVHLISKPFSPRAFVAQIYAALAGAEVPAAATERAGLSHG